VGRLLVVGGQSNNSSSVSISNAPFSLSISAAVLSIPLIAVSRFVSDDVMSDCTVAVPPTRWQLGTRAPTAAIEVAASAFIDVRSKRAAFQSPK
jgi:hypothetical protein